MVELQSFPANEAMARSLVKYAGPDAPGRRHAEAWRPLGRRRRSLGHPEQAHCAVNGLWKPASGVVRLAKIPLLRISAVVLC